MRVSPTRRHVTGRLKRVGCFTVRTVRRPAQVKCPADDVVFTRRLGEGRVHTPECRGVRGGHDRLAVKRMGELDRV